MELPETLLESMWLADYDDLPDGAWQQIIEDAVTEYNRRNYTTYDPFESWLVYIGSDFRANKINVLHKK